jgi:SulP family sulfate permease
MARTRYTNPQLETPLRSLPAAALRAVLAEGYSASSFRSDVLAGLVVGVVALPLAMALAVAVGVAPQHGLYTAIVAGAVVAIFGGSRLQVSGPTAAFIAILAPIQARFGLSGLLVSGLLAGLLLVGMGLLRLGKFIEFVPHPVTTGFTAGIGTVIAALQLKDLLGLAPARQSERFFERLGDLFAARGTFDPWELVVGLFTLALLGLVPRVVKRVPAPLVALPAAAALGVALSHLVPGCDVATIASRFSTQVGGEWVRGIPRLPPLPVLPWDAGGGSFRLDGATVNALLPGAFAIAMLGAIESLLSAVVADGMARTRHDPDAELLALGVGNVVAPFFGGIAATGAIARTATNVRAGARSPVAGVVHAVTVLAAVLAAAPLLGVLPMSALAALLLLVAWNMSDAKHFAHIVRVAPRSDVAVLLACYGLTVAFDMVVGVAVGMVLAAMLFMRRMAVVTRARLIEEEHPDLPGPLPKGVAVYDISGALFFGAANKAMAALGHIASRPRAVILRFDEVHAMDATGLVALESALDELVKHRTTALLAGVRPQPMELLRRARVHERRGVTLCESTAEALAMAEFMAGEERGEGDAATRTAARP